MNIHAEKLALIQWLTQLTDERIIVRIKQLRLQEADWWDELSPEEKADMNEGIAQSERGETTPHDKVMERFKSWRTE
ncbi:MAG: hypothetical protein EA392_00540 [Cryomorphaceae bacterium]|nr:MAG: hypothetical protein EA392_00540 [Cryomorphaceae bacterium]